jgi:hypothetical protein
MMGVPGLVLLSALKLIGISDQFFVLSSVRLVWPAFFLFG